MIEKEYQVINTRNKKNVKDLNDQHFEKKEKSNRRLSKAIQKIDIQQRRSMFGDLQSFMKDLK